MTPVFISGSGIKVEHFYRQTSMGIDIEYKQPFIPLVDQTRRKPKLIIPLRICFTKSFKVDYSTFWH